MKNDLLTNQILCPAIRYYCELLNVDLKTPQSVLKKNYYKLALMYHPDKNNNAEISNKLFSDAALAYNVLSNPEKIRQMNEEYIASIPQKIKIGNHIVNIGGFFGARYFSKDAANMYSKKRNIAGVLSGNYSEKKLHSNFFDVDYFEEENSILDSPEWDMFEIMFSGSMNNQTIKTLQDEFLKKGLECYYDLPWVSANMQGFLHFITINFKEASDIFLRLNHIIKNNIVFLYRTAICLESQYFFELANNRNPQKKLLTDAVEFLENAIEIGRNRFITEKQHCFTVRKTLAELYEVLGDSKEALKLWRYVLQHKNPYSIEAEDKIKDLSKIRFLPKKKNLFKDKINRLNVFMKNKTGVKSLEHISIDKM
ncbi:MAG TPA: DUF2225 domain-containing protein [bacterium]|nr:DUF2225 domain-containing protein [bacterium]HPN32533.1 DUF2225 domain-containing protein [bacterium]